MSCVDSTLLDRDGPMALSLLLVVILGASAIGWNAVCLVDVPRQAPALGAHWPARLSGCGGGVAALAGGFGVAYATWRHDLPLGYRLRGRCGASGE